MMFIPLDDKAKDDLFFSPGATLGSFASRIDIAYALGLITPAQKSDLNIIKRLRNAFAHAVKDIRFADPIISAQVRKLSSFVVYEDEARVDLLRRNYIFICYELISALNLAALANAERHLRSLSNLYRRNKFRREKLERRLSELLAARADLVRRMDNADLELGDLAGLKRVEPIGPVDPVPPMSELEPALRHAFRTYIEADLVKTAKPR
jgi:hypothetical protein